MNYELGSTHKESDSFKVENCNDNVTVSESCRNVQDVSAEKLVTKPSISCSNEDMRPNMTSDESCPNVKSHVIHNKFNIRVCTRSKDYGCSLNNSQNENFDKDNPIKEIDFENVLESQLSDDLISKIIQWKIDEVKPTWADVSHMSPEGKFYWSRLNSLILVNEILHRKWENYNGKHYACYDLHIVLPANFKRFVLNQVHNTVTGGHLGIRKTLSKIKQRYIWYKMRPDVKFWCTKCDICGTKKAPCKNSKAPMKQYFVGVPWERMAIDILGPLPCSVNNNRYLMVVQDYFSKWTEAIPIPDTEAVTVATKFVERIVTIFWVLLSIHSDQGSNFESHVFIEMCNILGIHKTRTTPFRSKSDGMVEKPNSTIETMLSAFVSKHQRDWDEYIYLLMLAYRSSEHESLGTSPYSMLFGREVNLPVDLILGRPETKRSPLYLKTVYAYELSQTLEVTVYTCGICHDYSFDPSIICKRLMTEQHSGFGYRCNECCAMVKGKEGEDDYRKVNKEDKKVLQMDSKKRAHRKEQDLGSKKQRTVLGALYSENSMSIEWVIERKQKEPEKVQEKKRTPEEERKRKEKREEKKRRKEEKGKEVEEENKKGKEEKEKEKGKVGKKNKKGKEKEKENKKKSIQQQRDDLSILLKEMETSSVGSL
ncbi:unnamed protein product [Mytilus coruscus]|uniref:Integrase catalytic domain-containing protein n=1 Tax=Mytilus coruscus TaxID=42192 RepID=A0A6J8AVP0_MYTCO|nr:unnamed protein product [Mytilus coruscus]